MATENVQILLEVVSKNIQALSETKAQLAQSREEVSKLNSKMSELNVTTEKTQSASLKLRKAILDFKKEMFIASLAIGSVVGSLALLSKSSLGLQSTLEDLGRSFVDALGPAGDIANYLLQQFVQLSKSVFDSIPGTKKLADAYKRLGEQARRSTGNKIPLALQAQLKDIESQTLKIQAKDEEALALKHEAELIKIKSQGNEQERALLEERVKARQDAERRSFELAKLGLKQQREIVRDFNRDIVQSFRGGLEDTLFNLFQGEKFNPAEALKGLRTSLNKALSEALSQATFTTIFGGGDFFSAFKDQLSGGNRLDRERNEKLDKINNSLTSISNCCGVTAQNTRGLGGGGGFGGGAVTATIEQAKTGILGKVGSIIGGFGSIAGGLGKLSSIASSGFSGTGFLGLGAKIPQIVDASQSFIERRRLGGSIRRFQSGGEVPAILHGGEFVVNKRAASENRDLLRGINSGSKPARGAQNVFLIKTNDAQSFSTMLSTPSARNQMEIQVMRAIMNNGEIRRVIKNFAR